MFEPAHYFPISNGRYEVKASLSRLDKSFGNPQDDKVFQIDTQWPDYFQDIQHSREENLDKYYLTADFDTDTRKAMITLMLNQMCEEYPEYFQLYKEKDGNFTLECHINKTKAHFDDGYQLLGTENGVQTVVRDYADLFDFICSHIQEDVSVIKIDGKHDVVAALHLCLPNHWAAKDKIGKCFAGAHMHVPNMDKINKSMETLSQQLIHKGPFVRFAWGLATDARLNHHPLAPEGLDPVLWRGRQFNPDKPELFLRVERQCMIGLKKVNAYTFFIRTYIENVKTLSPEERGKLVTAIESMNDDALKYKGLDKSKQDIITYLREL